MHHPNKVIDKTTLSEHLYAYDEDKDSNTIEVFIARLRKKLPEGLIETVRGLGYRLNDHA
jgi:two-component system OmpR family response regulator